ncbi:RraA family protein [Acrocarpospora catenulata]|uniref:RraA family protein n=1 Tax=Acrocarpospora catenulata TaxID=2836182 RepID=UPI001BDB59C9|nr:4-carboxy-4-hydroxy-2-oxoadipate aldolase/oxaloacetate decarboxylase [Acrocarpospora catenulata]
MNGFAQLGVSTVYEASGRAGLVDGTLIRVVPGSRAAGPARTVRCGQDDNLGIHQALDRVEPGEVLVAVMPRPAPVALVGELLAVQAKARGAAALLLDAAVRDVDELAGVGLPVWARWVCPRGAGKEVAGELDVPVEVGGIVIAPGDTVVLDGDGAVVVPAAEARVTLAASRHRASVERELLPRLAAGEATLDLLDLRTRIGTA